MKRVAAIQSNYIPWRGYLDAIAQVDEFILLDDVQYTKRDWRNRNQIKTVQGPLWLTIPVHVKGRYLQPINEVEVSESSWAERHWTSLVHSYGAANCYPDAEKPIHALYEEASTLCRLSDINRLMLDGICRLLGIRTPMVWSSQYECGGIKSERLLSLCEAAGATEYVSGPAARSYLDVTMFNQKGITVSWLDYSDYPEYPQLHPPFESHVSVLDLLFNTARDAPQFMKYVERSPTRRPVS